MGLLGLYMINSTRNTQVSHLESQLVNEAKLIANMSTPSFADPTKNENLNTMAKSIGNEIGTRITLISINGTVLGDTDEDPATMEKHATRPEVVAALESGSGQATRYSATLHEYMMYVAVQVTDQGSATLTWSAPGADSVSIDPLGSVDASGNRAVQPTPKKTDPGPVDETVTYTIKAANACGGSEVRTATLRLVGEIESVVVDSAGVIETELQTKLAMNSVYFPTALPTTGAPKKGLVPSQQKVLTELAGDFKKYSKEEMRRLSSLIIQAADQSRVPAGSALAVDRDRFACEVTERIRAHPRIHLVREEVTEIPASPTIIATGPLTSDALAGAIAGLTGQEHLHFYDADRKSVV
jgi:hypothetical protein